MSNTRHLSLAEMKAAKLRALVRATATCKKEMKKMEKGMEGASSLAPMVVGKGVPKRKADGKDECPSRKPSVTLREKKPSPPKPSHEAGKGLMTSKSPVTQGTRRLLTHKGYTIEIVESIIKEIDVNP